MRARSAQSRSAVFFYGATRPLPVEQAPVQRALTATAGSLRKKRCARRLCTRSRLCNWVSYPIELVFSGRILYSTRTSPGWAFGYLSRPRYFFAILSMCAAAPSSVISATVPRTSR